MYFTQVLDILLEECIMYLRKSRSDNPALTVEEVLRNHEKELDEWCEKNFGTTIPEDNRYREIVSGEKMSDRPELQKVLSRLEDKNIKYILCIEPTRLSRGYLDEIGTLIKLLRYNKIKVITPYKTFDMEDEYDREQFERELKRGNEYLEYARKTMYRGKMRKCADGEWIFNSAPYGYIKHQYKEGKRTIKTLVIDEEKANIVRMIFKWYTEDNMTIRAIENKLNILGIPSPSGSVWFNGGSVPAILSNPAYIGKVRFAYRKAITEVVKQEFVKRYVRHEDCFLFDGLHDAIIDEELYEKTQIKKTHAIPLSTKKELSNMFAGLVFCKKCGHAVKLQISKAPLKYMICRHTPHCNSSGIPYEEFVDTVCNILENCIDDFEIKVADDNYSELDEHEKLIQITENKLKKLEQTELYQWETQTNADVSQRMPQHIFKSLNDKVVREINEAKELLKQLYSNTPTKVNYESKVATFKQALGYIRDDSIDISLKNEFLKGFIDKIEMSRDKREILNKEKATDFGLEYNGRKAIYEPTPYHIEIFFKD